MALPNTNSAVTGVKRVRIWYGFIVIVMLIFGIRLFYVQVIRYNYYKTAALSDQLKQYEIPARRGVIKAHDGDGLLPLVLNQKLYTLYADPTYVKNNQTAAERLSVITGIDTKKLQSQLATKNTRYVILAKKLTPEQNTKILDMKLPGIGSTALDYRTYPQGSLAGQLLGFVDADGSGQYGLEQSLNTQLKGKSGLLKAITDASGVPLAASSGNIETPPHNGKDLVLTVDLAMQQQLETILARGVTDTKAVGGSAVIMDTTNGSVKAMANYPSYDPSSYASVDNPILFQNAAVSNPIEIGSIMKSLTTAAALDQGVIKPNTSYFDPSFFMVDAFRISNIEEDGGAGQRSIADILNLSLNTGATWELMQMGGGQINLKARTAWNNYLVNRFRFGMPTGIEQGYEASGYIPGPKDNGAGIDLTYANTAFGQAMTATPIQFAGALSAMINGGTYYQPHLVESMIDGTDTVKIPPKVLASNVVSAQTSQAMIPLMQNVVQKHYFKVGFDQGKYMVGGKTGTAQIAKPGGGYDSKEFNGTYAGFVGGDKPQYVIVVFVDKPQVSNGAYAGTAAAQPIFGDLAHMLINDSYVSPKS
jgi:stage V sporulation protein D (sporulation-specific penicillin-binding protein)